MKRGVPVHNKNRGKRGQVMVEYLTMVAMVVLMVVMLALFLYALREHGGRILDLVASEYP